MAKNLGPFSNTGGLFFSVVASWTASTQEVSLNSGVEAAASFCVIVVPDMISSSRGRCCEYCGMIEKPWG